MNLANELRINNFVLVDDSHVLPYWHKIRAKDIVDIENGNLFHKGIIVSPIELSSDILLKAGFAETIVSRGGQYRRFELDIHGLNFMFEVYGVNEPHFYLCMVGVDLFYLHQLQNLYFALMGTELHINI